MKTKIFYSVFFVACSLLSFAQDKTTVTATSSEISDNLDLRAIASIFGDSKDLEDFEYKINDPKQQISNLDLNNDNQVDYLRVIENIEGNTHIIVLQSVLGKDLYQDVATIEVQKDRDNRVQIQVVGDVYLYGRNYIYEPVYVHVPVIYNTFWVNYYRPYYSRWYWGYYPTHYYVWTPFPVFRYRHHIGLCINLNHHYNYVHTRRCQDAYNVYYGRRANAYERQYPNRSFENRNNGYANRYELDQRRTTRDVAFQSGRETRELNANTRGERTFEPRENTSTRELSPRNNSSESSSVRLENSTPRTENPRVRDEQPREIRNESPRTEQPRAVRNENPRIEQPRNDMPRTMNMGGGSRNESVRTESQSSGRNFGGSGRGGSSNGGGRRR